MKQFKQHSLLPLSVAAALALGACTAAHAVVSDPVILTFSTVGDSRQDPQSPDSTVVQSSLVGVGSCPVPYADTTKVPAVSNGLTANPGLTGQDCKWQQNSTAWSKILRNIQTQKANLLFFNGDMIMGYGRADVPVGRTSTGTGEVAIASPTVANIVTSDLMQFYQQYAFWRGMVANLLETGTYVVPVPGNHEVQCKRCGKTAQVQNETAWRDNMGDLIPDSGRMSSLLGLAGQSVANFNIYNNPYIDPTTLATSPAPYAAGTNPDGVTTDQKQLSFSFDVGTSHFAVVNTDPVGNDAHAPTTWLDADLTAATARGAKNFFVFGHKPAVPYVYLAGVAPSGLNSTNANAFLNVIAKHKATYFCGHEHTYNVANIAAPDGVSGSAYQVIVGAGGSPFDLTTANPSSVSPATDRLYSWATVKIRQSGAVTLDTYGFDDTLVNPVVHIATYNLPHL